MVKQKYKGIVLKSFTPGRNSLIMLDKEHGKFLGRVYQQKNISSGALLDYILDANKSFILSQINIVALPEHQARQDILFLHHVLELCNYFVPIGYKDDAVFELLYDLCSNNDSRFSTGAKRLVLFKACSLLGIYPEDTYFHTIFFQKLARLSIREMLRGEIVDNEMVRRLDKWIHQCILQHPFVSTFKTIHFLTSSEKS